MLDADGSADPAEIPRFVEALEAGADFAKGSRYLDGGGSADITWTCASSATPASAAPPTSSTAPTSPTSATATTPSGPAACPSSRSTCPGFEVETLINLRIAGAGMKITEVPSYEEERISGDRAT